MAYKKEFTELYENAVKEGVFPGCNLAVITKNGDDFKDVYLSFGKRALYPNVIDNDIDTLYDMASCTKVVATTTCAMMLLEQGKLRLYDTVKKYLPDYIHDDITIWDLMTHTAGLPGGVKGSWTMNREQIIDGIMHLEKIYPKNTKIAYSCCGYVTLGFVIEKITGMPLDEYAKKNIFEPLGMTHSCFNPKDISKCAPTEDRGGKIDFGYVHDEMCHNMGGVAGNAGLFSTVKDIAIFAKMILNGGEYNGVRILQKKTVDLLFVPQVAETNGVSLMKNMRCLGWIPKNENCCAGDFVSDNTIMHTGFTGTSIIIDKDNNFAYVLLSNRVHPTRENMKLMSFRARSTNYIVTHLEDFK